MEMKEIEIGPILQKGGFCYPKASTLHCLDFESPKLNANGRT